MAAHKTDARQLLDDRGYSGALIRGQNPALLFEKGVRERIVDSYYWKEQCFALNAATLCDRAVELNCIGGTYGVSGKPTPFLCLAFKLLQLVPEKAIILEYLNFSEDIEEPEYSALNGNDRDPDTKRTDGLDQVSSLPKPKGNFKYLRALAAFYIRLAWTPVEIHQTLEPLLTDNRKLKRRLRESFTITYMDQFIDDLLIKDRVCATSLWKMPARITLEDLDVLEPRESLLQGELDAMDDDDGDGMALDAERSEGSGSEDRSRRGSGSYASSVSDLDR